MKNLILKLSLFTSFIFLFVVVITSCAKDEFITPTDNLEALLKELRAVAEKENTIKHFHLYEENGMFRATELNSEEVAAFESANGFTSGANARVEGGGIRVSCSDGGSTFCPDGEGQGKCVDYSWRRCLRRGGSATTRKAVVSIE